MSSPRQFNFRFMDPVRFREMQVPRSASIIIREMFNGDVEEVMRLVFTYPEAMFYVVPVEDSKSQGYQFSPLAFALFTKNDLFLEIMQKCAKENKMLNRFLQCVDDIESNRATPEIQAAYSDMLLAHPDNKSPQRNSSLLFGTTGKYDESRYEERIEALRYVLSVGQTEKDKSAECVMQ